MGGRVVFMERLIDIVDVYKIYNPGEYEVRALDGVSLSIGCGEFVAIIGSSGSGKSTLMNMLGCLDMPSGGEYYLDGQEISSLDDDSLSAIRNREIGFIFQGFNLIPGMSVLENVELPLMYRGLARDERRRLASRALDRVGLSGRLRHLPTQISGGQQQRVAIARAIAAKPPIILADEPTGNLDSRSGREVMRILTELWRDGKTIILITHDNEIAAESKRCVHIHDGKIISDVKSV